MNFFGTDGIRTRVGKNPLTTQSLIHIGNALGLWAQEKYGANVRFLLAHDTRISCSWVKSALKAGLLRHNITLADAGVLPSPAVLRIMQEQKQFECGIIISASHNPFYDNGIKLIDIQGKLSVDDELRISYYMNTTVDDSYETFGTEYYLENASNIYQESIIKLFNPTLLSGQTIIIDCAQGATYHCAPNIFKQLGANVITLATSPNGYNINDACGSLHLEELQKKVLQEAADIGFAFDGDGDRLMIVTRTGVRKDGDDILACLITNPQYRQQKTLAGTVMSNQGLEHHLTAHHKKLFRTAVGDKFVAEYLIQENLLLGGEPSGHIILRDYLPTGDGIFTALKVMETMLLTNNLDLHTFEKFPQIIINIPVVIKKDLNQPPLSTLIAEAHKQLQGGRLLVRYSGTEPLLRIMIEDSNEEHAHSLSKKLSKTLSHELS